jgi:hypothetical protein
MQCCTKYADLRISLCDTSSDRLYIILLSSSKAVLYMISSYTDKLYDNYTQVTAILCYYCRMFWAISFILAIATAAYFITLLYHKWEENPVIVSVGATATQLTSIPFPALTICNMNRAKKSVAKEIANPQYV